MVSGLFQEQNYANWVGVSWTNWTRVLSTCGAGGKTWEKTKKTTFEQEPKFGQCHNCFWNTKKKNKVVDLEGENVTKLNLVIE